jgi:hypothetical protein
MSGSSPPKPSVRPRPVRVQVVHGEDGWQVRHSPNNVSRSYQSQAEATEAARAALRKSGGQLIVHETDGRVRKSSTLGRHAMALISAVEGIRYSSETEEMLADLDRRGASFEERRRQITALFGKKP